MDIIYLYLGFWRRFKSFIIQQVGNYNKRYFSYLSKIIASEIVNALYRGGITLKKVIKLAKPFST